MVSPGKKILIIIENLPAPFDRRVWQEANCLMREGYQVSIICPTGKGFEARHEVLEGIHIFRHSLPFEASGVMGYVVEYSCALFWEFVLAFKVLFSRGFDVIQACNPPDLIFIVGGFFKIFMGKKFVFDHHDINPELWLAKGKKKDVFYNLLLACERATFKTADICLSTNESYKQIALERGGKNPEDVFVVRSAPQTDKIAALLPKTLDTSFKCGKTFMVGYVGVMAHQDGLDYLLKAAEYIVKVKKRTDIHFCLIGKGLDWESLVAHTKEMSLDDYVTFTGRISDEEMVARLSVCDVCVNPDEANDFNDKSTMNKIMEYMALGKPIVQFEMREGRFSAQKASLYAKPNDIKDFAEKILELLADKKKAAEMGAFGKQRLSSELSWVHSEKHLCAAYQRLFNKPSA